MRVTAAGADNMGPTVVMSVTDNGVPESGPQILRRGIEATPQKFSTSAPHPRSNGTLGKKPYPPPQVKRLYIRAAPGAAPWCGPPPGAPVVACDAHGGRG